MEILEQLEQKIKELIENNQLLNLRVQELEEEITLLEKNNQKNIEKIKNILESCNEAVSYDVQENTQREDTTNQNKEADFIAEEEKASSKIDDQLCFDNITYSDHIL